MQPPSGFRHFDTDANGVQQFIRWNDDGTFDMLASHDAGDLLEANRELQNDSDGWNADKSMRSVARIDPVIELIWRKEGIFLEKINEPEVQRKLKLKLNDPEWRHLRTSLWRF